MKKQQYIKIYLSRKGRNGRNGKERQEDQNWQTTSLIDIS